MQHTSIQSSIVHQQHPAKGWGVSNQLSLINIIHQPLDSLRTSIIVLIFHLTFPHNSKLNPTMLQNTLPLLIVIPPRFQGSLMYDFRNTLKSISSQTIS